MSADTAPIEILRYFYGDDMYINTAEQISGIPCFLARLRFNHRLQRPEGTAVQEQLDAIATVYSAIPHITPDGIYGPATAAAVREFQSILVFR